MKNLKLPLIASIIAETVLAAMLIYFYTRVGSGGMLAWNMEYKVIFQRLCVLLSIPPMAFLFTFMADEMSKKGKTATVIFSTITFLLDLVIFLIGVGFIIFTGVLNTRVYAEHSILENSFDPAMMELPVDGDLHIAIASDPHWLSPKSNGEVTSQIMRTVENGDYDAFFILGDIVDQGSKLGIYEVPVRELNREMGSTLKLVVMGNHDAALNSASVFNQYFHGTKKYPLWYKFSVKIQNGRKVNFIVLNLLWDGHDFTKKQKKFLEAALSSIPQEEPVVVLSHAFILSSGYNDNYNRKVWADNEQLIQKVCPILEAHKVDLVISGHNHLQEILEKDGVVYAVSGGMGGALDSAEEVVSPYTKWHKEKSFGFVDFTSDGQNIVLNYKDVNGNTYYSYEIDCK